MDAGGLAQMSYQNGYASSNTLGIPTSGFSAARNKGSQLRNINVNAPPSIHTLAPPGQEVEAPLRTPGTSKRAHLLSGLRTAPKTPTVIPDTPSQEAALEAAIQAEQAKAASAQYNQRQSYTPRTDYPTSQSRRTASVQMPRSAVLPQTNLYQGYQNNQYVNNDYDAVQESKLYAELYTANALLAQRQQQLQQQLLSIHLAEQAQQYQILQQQFAGLAMQNSPQNFATPPMSPNGGSLNAGQQQLANLNNMYNGAVNNGLYPVFNPMTGQYNYLMQAQPNTPASAASSMSSHYPQSPDVPSQAAPQENYRRTSPERNSSPGVYNGRRTSRSPSRSPPNQHRVSPPPPIVIPSSNSGSAGPWKRGHKKASSLSSCVNASSLPGAATEAPLKTSYLPPASSRMPTTPLTATFGPSQSVSGIHPIRQPRGPPSLEEIKAKPTTKHEGSKNFATRQRRRAVLRLVSKGLERRSSSGSSSGMVSGNALRTGSGSMMTPVDEADGDTAYSFALPSEEGLSSSQSSIASSGRDSRQSLHSSPSISITEEPEDYSATSLSGDEGCLIGGDMLQIKLSGAKTAGLRAPQLSLPVLVLSEATDKRRSALF